MSGALDGAREDVSRAKTALLNAERALTILPIADESRRPEIRRTLRDELGAASTAATAARKHLE